ncbi:MAG: hypothetical protein ABIG69_04065 [Bacteroidota bacterium]
MEIKLQYVVDELKNLAKTGKKSLTPEELKSLINKLIYEYYENQFTKRKTTSKEKEG